MTFRIVFAILAGFTGLTAVIIPLKAIERSKDGSMLEVGVVVVGEIVAIGLLVFAFKTARQDVGFRIRRNLRRRG